jgi:transcriptional regulator with XRE-family HTH domain
MDLARIFVKNLKKWRKDRGFSQKVLAERCDTAHSYIRQIESGKGHPSFIFIGKLANALDIEPYQLLYDRTKANQDLNQIKTEDIEAIKSDFLGKISNEFNNIVEKLGY